MPQIFVSYARADKRQVSKLVQALRNAGFETWWDDDIPPGAGWEQTIETALASAERVIVCWSPTSVASENVRSEARVARTNGRLIQVFVAPCDPPLFFGERQGIDLAGWNGSSADPRFERLEQVLRGSPEPGFAPRKTNAPALSRPTRKLALGVAGLFAALLIVVGWWWSQKPTAEARSKVAVAAISALGSGAPEAAQGLTDQIRTSLNDAHIPTVSPADSGDLTGASAEQNLKQLGIGYTIEGTVQASGTELVARIHLDDRVRHATLWSYQANGAVSDPVALNYDVARSIASVVSCAYRALGPGGLQDTDLLSRYLRVCDLFVNHNDASDARSTYELLDDLRLIMAKAPDFAPAQSDFAKFAAYLAPLLPPEQAAGVREESAKAARRALELNPHAADAYVAQEMLLKPTDWAKREALLRKAVEVDPKWPHGNGFLAMLLSETGRIREAAVYGQRAAAADLQISWKPFGPKMSCDAGQFDGPITDLKEQLSSSPNDDAVKWSLRGCLLDAGRYAEAVQYQKPAEDELGKFRQAAEQALASGAPADFKKAKVLGAKFPTDGSLAPSVSTWSATIGDTDTAFRFADAFAPGYPMTGITDFLFQPQTASMRRDPRFFALMKRYGLTDFWQTTGRWPDFCAGNQMQMCKAAIAKAAGS